MSLAPERLTIGLRRLFTAPGVDPYDEVVWERRDARIANLKDGTVAFEQPGVEFPAGWSQNATNIVAQKYFRGTLGTPERESSLRQVIDRVADTITQWGHEGGYFVDAAEERAFSDELKYILVTQRAAFNSPVWFNIGVNGVPQQASACQPYDALVSTPEGLVPIGELVERDAVGTKVLDARGVTSIVATKANGRKRVLRLHTKAGYTLDVTPDHLVWRASDATGGRFVPAGDLRPGDQLVWHRTESWGDGEITLTDLSESALAGWLQSDGFVGQYDHGTNRSLTIEFLTVTEAEYAWVLSHLDVVFPDVHRHVRDISLQDPSLVGRRIRLYGEALRPFVDRWELRTRGAAMTVPAKLFTAPLPVVRAYLRSVFQAEGSVSVRERAAVVALDMVGQAHVRGLQQLLSRFGIFARVRRKEDKRSDRQGTWSLTVRPRPERDLFATELPFIDPKKQDRLERSLTLPGVASNDAKRLQIDRVEDLGEMEVYDIQTESGEYLSSAGLRVHNCFILAVDDTMDSILNWYREEGIIFKGGSGSGVNLSRIRSSRERLQGGGTASGPVSFMRGADASAGTIKSGGKTRRAAKMVVLNADHPDVGEFIWCKAREERKARALRDAGFDMDLDGIDSFSVQYQNANNSVRVTDEFMRAVREDADWALVSVTTGEVLQTVRARDLWHEIAQAAWECADPGLQFDTTINKWHTAATTGRINASNPCFTGDTLVHTDKGLIRFRELFDRANHGEEFQVWTHDLTNADEPRPEMVLTTPDAFMITGRNPIVRLRFDNGMELRCTPGHRIFTTNRGYVEAAELTDEDQVRSLDLPAPAVNAEWAMPVTNDADAYHAKGDHAGELRLPEVWSEEFAHYLGWLIGDGSTSGPTTSTIYGSAEDRDEILPRHQELVEWINGDRPLKISEQANGTAQLRMSRRAFKRYLEALGVASVTGEHKRVPWSIEQSPTPIVAAFLRGLFDADGCAVVNSQKGSYVGLGSISPDLLRGVQRLLSTFGITSRVYNTHRGGGSSFSHQRKDGTTAAYARRAAYDLRITGSSLTRFAAEIGFDLSRKATLLRTALMGRFYDVDTTIRLVGRTDDGIELTYNLREPRNHSYVANGVVVRNCSEYVHLDNSACNLASINLLKFLDPDGSFDTDAFRHTVEIVFTAQEILVGRADYPTPQIAETSRAFRQLGLGYTNLGALLMALGLPYDSTAGRAWAAALTSLLTGHAYATSARIASRMGPFSGFADNEEHMLRVLRMHRDASHEIDGVASVPVELVRAGQDAWETAVGEGEDHGVRNSQATVLAPTGTISFMMDCDTTGIEPDLGLVKMKKLVGGGTMSIVNQTVPRALRNLGYTDEQVDDIVAYIDHEKSIVGAPHLAAEHLPVFACSMGDNVIHYEGHVRMLGAVQPFLSGAASKTINMPEDVTVEDVEGIHMLAWELGLKAVAIYRDNCKVGQPLSTAKKDDATAGEATKIVEKVIEKVVHRPARTKLPRSRRGRTFEFRVADCKGFATIGEYDDGRPGEVFLTVSKQGSTLSGIMDAFAKSISYGLQYGVPLRAFVEAFTNMRFEPAGMTDDPDIRFATSIMDYLFRRLAIEYLSVEERAELGIFTVDERMQPTLPGVEESVIETSTGSEIVPDPKTVPSAGELAVQMELGTVAPTPEDNTPAAGVIRHADAPMCMECGVQMIRAGSCYACPSCGSTSGCS